MQTINSIEAAKLEATGKGAFTVAGRSVHFDIDGRRHTWNCRTSKDAKDTLRLFRSSLKFAARCQS